MSGKRATVDKPNVNSNNKLHCPYLSLGDSSFHDLCGGRDHSDGIKIPIGPSEIGILHQSVIIAGLAGTGKTTFAAQVMAFTLIRNNFLAGKRLLPTHLWPSNAQGLFYAIDQSAADITEIFSTYKWFGSKKKDFEAIPYTTEKDKFLNLYMKHATAKQKADILNSSIIIRKLPYGIKWEELKEIIEGDVRQSAIFGLRIKIITIDSLNLIGRSNVEGNELTMINSILSDARNANLREEPTNYITIAIDEMDELSAEGRTAVMREEYLPDVVFLLNREKDSLTRRTIEIRKARRQPHLIGSHEFRIADQADQQRRWSPPLGINVYPSIAARSRMIPETNFRNREPRKPIKFGINAVDQVLGDQSKSWHLVDGSTTLLWGDPGTGKTELCVRFLNEQWKADFKSSVLFLTNKIDPTIIRHDLRAITKSRGWLATE